MEHQRYRTPQRAEASETARRAAVSRAFGGVAQPVTTPEPVTPMAPAVPVAPKTPASEPTSVSINISLPAIRLPKVHARATVDALTAKVKQLARKIPAQMAIRGVAALVVLIVLVSSGSYLWHNHQIKREAALTAAAAEKVKQASNVSVKPKFKPVTPANKTELADGEAGKTSYDAKHDTFSYSDQVGGNPVTVSQQPLPSGFDSVDKAVVTIAKSMHATTPIVTNRGTAYVATDTKSNAQTVVYSFNNLLIFINSPFTHQSNEWKAYLENLKQN